MYSRYCFLGAERLASRKTESNGSKRAGEAFMTSTRPAPKPENLLRRPAHPDISEALVHDLVFAFYDRIRADATLGPIFDGVICDRWAERSEAHTSELQSLMRISYDDFCLKKT